MKKFFNVQNDQKLIFILSVMICTQVAEDYVRDSGNKAKFMEAQRAWKESCAAFQRLPSKFRKVVEKNSYWEFPFETNIRGCDINRACFISHYFWDQFGNWLDKMGLETYLESDVNMAKRFYLLDD